MEVQAVDKGPCAETPNVPRIITESHDNRPKKCHQCNKIYASRNALWRHRRDVHNNNGCSKVLCRFCGNAYRRRTLSAHEKKCSTNSGNRRRQDCTFEGCSSSFYKKEHLIEHLIVAHQMEIEPVKVLTFKTVEDFKSWKEEEEDHTFSFYSKHAGTKKNTNTFYCQQEGSERQHRSAHNLKDAVRHNKKGRIKRGKACTSYIRVKYEPEVVTAYYSPTHSHPISPDDVKHHPLSEATLKFIKEQIKLNIPTRQIQAAVKKRLADSENARGRDAHVSLKRISNMARRFRTAVQCPNNTSNAVDLFNAYVDVLCAQVDSPILLYQPPSENACLEFPNEEDHLFFLAVQTTDQQNMLQRGSAMPMFISVTKSEYTFQYYLISIVVPCEKNFEYPVGHLISSQMNEEVVSLFLQSIGERCPDLNVNCVVSVDNPEINSAIKRVFGSDGPYFLSKWHFLEYVQNNLLSAVPSDRVEELFDFILAMADSKTEDRFLFLYNSFKEQYEPEFSEILSAFSEHIVRAASWASCYRQYPGIIDSCLYVDAFQSKFHKKYRRRPNKNLNLLLELVLQMQEDYREGRDGRQLHNQDDETMKEQHSMALEIPSELVQETLLHHWTVQASKHGQAFCVMQCASKCSEKECTLKCKDCLNLCSHLYFCTCGKIGTICMHVHKVFLEHGSSLEMENLSTGIMEDEDLEEYSPMEEDEPREDVQCNNADLKLKIIRNLESLKQVLEEKDLSDEFLSYIQDTLQKLVNNCDEVIEKQ